MDFSRADALLIASSGSATSMSFFVTQSPTPRPHYFLCLSLSRRLLRAGKQLVDVVVDTCYAEIRLATERPAQVPHLMGIDAVKLHDRQNEIVRLIQRVHDLVVRDVERIRVGSPSLDFDESQLAR